MKIVNNSTYLSICIPTYNRCEKVAALAKYILANYSGDDIEVVVLDNVSSDKTEEVITKISDSRLSYFRNEINIGGPVNLIKAITLGKGEYSLLCLDKDAIEPHLLSELISRLKEDENVKFGHCNLNIAEAKSDIIYDEGYHSLFYMAYLSEHPSGSFYKTQDFKGLTLVEQIILERKHFGFHIDVINGEMAMIGKSRLINIPFIKTETREESSKIRSHSYTNKDAFFLPKQRFRELSNYLESIISKKIAPNDSLSLIKNLYVRFFDSLTVGYRLILKDKNLCEHYAVSSRDISKYELMRISMWYSYKFYRLNSPISKLEKINLILRKEYRFLRLIFF